MLKQPVTSKESILALAENWESRAYFLEDYYHLTGIRALLGQPSKASERLLSLASERLLSFILGCQRSDGGFSRAWIMGIPTLEYTYYAISLLKQLEVL